MSNILQWLYVYSYVVLFLIGQALERNFIISLTLKV